MNLSLKLDMNNIVDIKHSYVFEIFLIFVRFLQDWILKFVCALSKCYPIAKCFVILVFNYCFLISLFLNFLY